MLSHVESCPRCAEELEVLSRTADTVVQAAPEMEPPLGFEVRLFERMGVTDVRRRRRRLRPSRWVPAVVGVAAAALALGTGAEPGVVPAAPTGDRARRSGSHQVVTAALVANGKTVGHVMTVGRRQAVDVDDARRFERRTGRCAAWW